jgi:hypothetical protein
MTPDNRARAALARDLDYSEYRTQQFDPLYYRISLLLQDAGQMLTKDMYIEYSRLSNLLSI